MSSGWSQEAKIVTNKFAFAPLTSIAHVPRASSHRKIIIINKTKINNVSRIENQIEVTIFRLASWAWPQAHNCLYQAQKMNLLWMVSVERWEIWTRRLSAAGRVHTMKTNLPWHWVEGSC